MPDRFDITIADLHPADAYALTTTCFIPRPIAWVSSLAADGSDNLAPHSFTTVAGVDPLTVCFTSIGVKDTLRNIRATGEFVLHIGGEHQMGHINDSGTPLRHGRSEFDAAGITRAPSVSVKPPRIAAAPIAFECVAAGEHAIGDSYVVFGRVQHISIDRAVLAPDGKPDARLVAPMTRLGRTEWARLGDIVAMERITEAEWDAGARSEQPI